MTPRQADLVFTGILLAFVAVTAWGNGAIGIERSRRRAAARFARRSGLPAEPPAPALVARVARRNRFVMAGVAAGAALSSLDAGGSFWPVLLYLGLAIGAVVARFTEPAPPESSPRVAHAAETAVGDYVPGWLLLVVRLTAAAVVGYAVLALAAPRRDDPAPPVLSDVQVALLAVLAVAGCALAGMLARLVVRRRRAVVSADELDVDDALRGSAVRDCFQLSAAISLLALLATCAALTDQPVEGFSRRVGGWTPVVALAAVAVVGTVFELTGGHRWWRSRLRRREPAA
jgi:hypothetical protein